MAHNFTHESELNQSESMKGLDCPVPDCGKHFRFKSELDRHLIVHSLDRTFVCEVAGCGKTFKRADTLANHVRMHNNDTAFSCKVDGCDKQFTTKAALRYHVLKHEGQKTYKCRFPDCDRSFLTLAQLKQHEKASLYHQKIDNAHILQATRAMKQEAKPAVQVQVKEEISASETQSCSHHSETAIYDETYKKVKTEADSPQSSNVMNTLNSLNNLPASPAVAKKDQVNSQDQMISSLNIDPKLKDQLINIVRENRRLKDNLNNMMFLDGMFANLRNFPLNMANMANMGLYGYQAPEMTPQNMAAFQYNMSHMA